MKASHSKLTTFKRCRRKYHWSYNYNKDTGSSAGQVVGTIGHAVLAYWYMNQNSPSVDRDCITKAETMGLDRDVSYDDIARLQRALSAYFAYARDLDVLDVISTEQHITKTIGKHTIEGYVDMIGLLPDGKRVAYEHKFNKRPDLGNVTLDQQITMYQWLADVDCVTFNIVNVTTAKNTKTAPVLRETITRTPQDIALFLEYTEAQLDEMMEFDSHPERERYAYPTPNANCSWDCQFFAACKAFQSSGDILIVQDMPDKIWNRE